MKQSEAEPRKPREKYRPSRRIPKKREVIQNTTELTEVSNEALGEQEDHIREIIKSDYFNIEVTQGRSIKTNVVEPAILRDVLLKQIDGSMAARVEVIRQQLKKENRDESKEKLSHWSTATYNQNEEGILIRTLEYFEDTRLMMVDYDGIKGGEAAVAKVMQNLAEVPEVMCAFRSPSSVGVRALMLLSEPVRDPKLYSRIYKKEATALSKKIGLDHDPSGSNANHVWFLTHDPDMLIREAPPLDVSQHIRKENQKVKQQTKRMVQASSHQKKAAQVKLPDSLLAALLELKAVRLDYYDWYQALGFQLATLLGEDARDLWVDISYNEHYDDEVDYLDLQYDNLLNDADPEMASVKVLEKLLKKHGIDYKPEENADGAFWSINKGEDGKIKIYTSVYDFSRFTLVHLGFFYDEDTEKIGRLVSGNLVRLNVTTTEIKNTIIDFVMSFGLESNHEHEILEQVTRHSTMYFSSKTLEFIPVLSLNWHRDDATYMYKYHQKGIYRLSRTDQKLDQIGYHEIGDFYVNEENILDWDGTLVSKEEAEASDISLFIKRSNGSVPARIEHAYCLMGYLSDSRKLRSEAIAVVLHDERMQGHGIPNGGGGKSLSAQIIMDSVRPSIEIDGGNYQTSDRFKNQNVIKGTRLVSIDDVGLQASKTFFSAITGNFKVEVKNQTSESIPFAISPKLLFSSNDYFPGAGSSNLRRFVSWEISDYYNMERTPVGESEREFFGDEWTNDDKNLTHSLWLLTILPTYLKKGLSRLPSPSLERNRIISETSEDFVVWGKTNLTKNVQRVEVNVLRDQCMQEVGSGTWRSLDKERNLFSKWMRNFVEGQGLVLKRSDSNTKTLISIVSKEGVVGAEVQATSPSKTSRKRPIISKKPTTKSNTIDDVFDE